jgi:hypothetical protein
MVARPIVAQTPRAYAGGEGCGIGNSTRGSNPPPACGRSFSAPPCQLAMRSSTLRYTVPPWHPVCNQPFR